MWFVSGMGRRGGGGGFRTLGLDLPSLGLPQSFPIALAGRSQSAPASPSQQR